MNSFFARPQFVFSLLCLATLTTGCKWSQNSHNARIQVKFEHATQGFNAMSSGTSSPFADNHCYFINVTREETSVCSTGASHRVGELFGPVAKGGDIVVRTAAGPLRFDLLAFQKEGSCEGTFALEQLGAGKFKASLEGQSYEPIWLVSTKQFEALAGSQLVTMQVLGTSTNEMGVSLACDSSKKPNVTSVSMTGTDMISIHGTQLEETSRVSVQGLNAKFEIVTRSETRVTARILETASFLLGQTHNLLVSNAWGQSAVALNVQLSNGSVRPEHLDMTKDWPFPTLKTLSFWSQVSHSDSTTVTDLNFAIDNSGTTFAEFSPGVNGASCDSMIDYYSPAGLWVFKIGNGDKPYVGKVDIKIGNTSTSYSYYNLYVTDDSSKIDTANMTNITAMGGSLEPSSEGWKSFTFDNAKYFIFSPSCAQFSGDSLKLFDIRVTAQPVL